MEFEVVELRATQRSQPTLGYRQLSPCETFASRSKGKKGVLRPATEMLVIPIYVFLWASAPKREW